jgi:enamine deaminase RidA (YjgF/YER057c/UK114 family)
VGTFESVPFGGADGRNAMGIQVAFCNAMALDVAAIKRLIWVSGQLAIDEANQLVGTGEVGAQTEQCLKNIQRNLEQLGGSLDDVVQVIVFVRDMTGLREIHDVRLRYFKPPYPSSTLVAVSGFVHPDALIEINAVAAVRAGVED